MIIMWSAVIIKDINLHLTATLDAEIAYSVADFIVETKYSIITKLLKNNNFRDT
jgi:hypothetical protein